MPRFNSFAKSHGNIFWEPYFRKMTSFFQCRHRRLKFWTYVCFLKLNPKIPHTSQKRLMASLKLNIGQKMLRFRKMISRNLKTGKLFHTLVASDFRSYFWINLTQTQAVNLKKKKSLLSRIYTGDFFACDFWIKMDVAKSYLFNNGSHCDESYLTAESDCLKLFPFR